MIHKIVTHKSKDGKPPVYGVIYKDDPNKEVHYLSKEQITAEDNGEELLTNFSKVRNEKKKIRNIEHIYGIIMPHKSDWLFAVKFKDSAKIDIVSHRSLKKYNITALLQFYESHMDFLHDQMHSVAQKQKNSKPKSHHSHEHSHEHSHNHSSSVSPQKQHH
ncbi:hypothetical protein M9Y10_045284 [Tritrichomonas musculus]|uniref:Uncharacterized protein n=1 Tax=Tritrichomonas musculus TaxID=1915356 RepID=A0ABR2JV70_9EUKA